MSIFCPHCGHENIAGADNCEECHQDLQPESLPQPTEGLQKRIMSESIYHLKPNAPVLVRPEMPVRQVVEKMRERKMGSALVVDEDENLIGIFTDRDLLQKVGFEQSEADDIPIHALMTLDPVVLREDDSIAYALNKMSVGGFRHIPIVKGNKPVGVITVKDVFHHLCLPESVLEEELRNGPDR